MPGIDPAAVSIATTNQQVAPTIMALLGLEPSELQAVQKEQIHTLPIPAEER